MDRITLAALAGGILLIGGVLVFRRAGADYVRYGKLTRSSSLLQILLFVGHGASSLVFLDSDFGAIDTGNPLFGLAALLIVCGLGFLLSTLGRFGMRRASGGEVGALTCSGMYRRTRNPQVISYGVAVLGYALLWPSWTGIFWLLLYLVLAHRMVTTEESHLKAVFGKDYVEYCEQTPRYFDLPGTKK
jgi:protein-S-isoprenylcysteine O-methyltransferase Ste14